MALDLEIEALSLAFMWVFCAVFCTANYLSYRRAGYPYLRLAVATLLVELVRQTANDLIIPYPFAVFYLVSSVAFFCEALLCLATIRSVGDRPLASRTLVLATAGYLLFTALTSRLDVNARWAWYLKYLPLLLTHVFIVREAWRLFRQRWPASGWLLTATGTVMSTRLVLPWLSVHINIIYGFAYFADGLLFSLTLGTVTLIALEQLSAERSQNLARRRQAESTLRFLLDNSADVIISYEDDGQILSWNNRARETFGYQDEEVVGKMHIDRLIVPAADGSSRRWETRAFTSEGGQLQVEVAHRQGVQGPRIVHTLVIRDLTTVRRIEQRQEQLSDQLREVQKLESLGVLAAGVAHDFNNLLASMMGHAEVAMKQLARPADARQAIEQILTATHRASELTGQLLRYAGKADFSPRPIDLNSTIEEIVRLMRASVSARTEFELELTDEGAWIEADRAQVTQVLINLVSNASDAVSDSNGRVHISTSNGHRATPDAPVMSLGKIQPATDYVLMQISDNGVGMTEAVRDRIFEPFYSTKFTGRGLGLAAVAGIVTRHAGAVNVTSTPGKGTTFSFYFPASHSATMAQTPDNTNYEPVVRGRSVLIVDDKPELVDLYESILQAAGNIACRAYSGEDAIAMAGQRAIDLLVIDYSLPGISGIEVYETLVGNGACLPAVFVTGTDTTSLRTRLDPAWPVTILKKPFVADELLKAADSVSGEEMQATAMART